MKAYLRVEQLEGRCLLANVGIAMPVMNVAKVAIITSPLDQQIAETEARLTDYYKTIEEQSARIMAMTKEWFPDSKKAISALVRLAQASGGATEAEINLKGLKMLKEQMK